MNTKALRQKILDLAIHGKLVPQDPNDEPASVLLERIRAEKERLIKEGKIKKPKKTKAACDKPHYEYELPKGWMWTTLDDLAFYKKGPFGSSLTKSMFVPKSNSTYKVYEQKNAIQKNSTLGTYYITKEKFDSLSGFAVQPFDIIVSCAGTIGETYVLPNNTPKGIINQALMLIRLYNREIERFYLLYFDFILKEEAQKNSKGTAIKNIPPFDVLKNFLIPIPPIEEQKRILKEIDKWMSLVECIDQGKDCVQTAIRQAKSKILDLAIHGKLVPQNPNDEPANELLKRINPKAEITCDTPQYGKLPKGWCSCTLKNVCSFTNGFAFSSDAYKNNGIPLVRISNITNEGRIDLNSCVYIQDEIDEPYIIEKGDLLVAMSGATTGKMGVYTYGEISYLNQRVGKIKASKALYTPYMHYLMYSQVDNILKMAYGGAQPNISAKAILAIRILLPPLAEQHRIVAKIEEIFAQLDKIESSL